MMKSSASDNVKGFFHSIKFELLVCYVIICIIVMTLGSYLVYKSAINILQKRSEEYILEQFRQYGHNILNFMNELDRLSMLFIFDEKVQEFLKAENIDFTYESFKVQQDAYKKIDEFINSNTFINSIYIFFQNMGLGASKNRSVVIRRGGEHKFYTTGMFDKAWNAYPKTVWNTGITEEWFYDVVVSGSVLPDTPHYIISIARAVKPISETNLSAVIVFNMNESYLCSIYSEFSGYNDNSVYMIDSHGNIISSSKKGDIGKAGGFIPKTGFDFGSINMDMGKTRKLIVYYRINSTDYYIVKEIPMMLFSKDVVSLRNVVVFVFVISIMLIVAFSFFWTKRITDPLSGLAAKMKDMGKGKLGITFPRIPKNELGLVIMQFNEMSLNIRELVKKIGEIEREKRETEIESLQSQINPHFLYNTLNMVKWMAAVIKAKNIVDSIVALANILTPLFDNSDPMYTLREEIDYLKNYIKIMNWRFSDRIVFKFDIPEHLMDFRIIKFMLQPIIENSVVHGMNKQNSSIEINIIAKEIEEGLLINISDNGTGITQEELTNLRNSLNAPLKRNKRERNGSIGLCNVNRRIRLNFGEMYGISIDSHEGEGTNVSIAMPKTLE